MITPIVAASAEDVDMAEAGEASSRPASARHTGVEGTSEVPDDQPVTEADIQGSPQQSSQFQLPPDIAEPPDRLCSATVQVTVCLCKPTKQSLAFCVCFSMLLELQEKIVKLLGIQSKGRFLNAELRSSRPYRNPDFLSHTVKHFELDPHGTCYPKDVFDPNALHKEDYYDKLTDEFSLWRERKSQQQQQNQRVEFVRGGTEKAAAGSGGLQTKAQVAAMQAKAQAVVSAAQHKGGRNKWDSGPAR